MEAKFERLLQSFITVDFMGTVEWFLGTHFQWMITPNLSQTGFASHLVEDHKIHTRQITPFATPNRSGLPIYAIPESEDDNKSSTFVERKRKYQSLVCSFGWLAQCIRPDLAPAHSFLSAYCNKPLRGHWNAALYVLHYIHSTTFPAKADQSEARLTRLPRSTPLLNCKIKN